MNDLKSESAIPDATSHQLMSIAERTFTPNELRQEQQEIKQIDAISSFLKPLSWAESIGQQLVAYAGLCCFLNELNKVTSSNNDSKQQGIICFEMDNYQQIRDIVVLTLAAQKKLQAKDNKLKTMYKPLAYLEFHLPKTPELKEAFYPAHGATTANRLLGISEDDIKQVLCNEDQDAAYWRNNQIEGKFVVSIITGAAGTTATIPKIDTDSIREILPSVISNFTRDLEALGLNALSSYAFFNHYNTNTLKQLKDVLELLRDDANFSYSPQEMAMYFGYTLVRLKQLENQRTHDLQSALKSALGLALPVLQMPINTYQFTIAKRSNKKDFKNTFKNLYNCCGELRNRLDNTGNHLRIKGLENNFYQLLNRTDISGDNDTKKALNDWEKRVIEHYLKCLNADADIANEAFKLLCFINWHDRLEHLFTERNKPHQKKASLGERTIELFKNYQDSHPRSNATTEAKDDTEVQDPNFQQYGLTSDEVSLINSIENIIRSSNRDASAKDDRELIELYELYQSHRNVFDTNKGINREWQKLLFTQRLSGEDFLFNLSKALFSFYEPESNTNIQRITINLAMSNDKLTKLNYNVANFFSHRYGILLHDLTQLRIGNSSTPLFAIKINDRSVSDDENPLLNYATFFEKQAEKQADQKKAKSKRERGSLRRSTSSAKSATTLVFELQPIYSNGSKGIGIQFNWNLNPKSINMAFSEDLSNLYKSNVLQVGSFRHRLFTSQGLVQNLDLSNKDTFLPSKSRILGAVFLGKNKDSQATENGDGAVNLSASIDQILASISDKIKNEIDVSQNSDKYSAVSDAYKHIKKTFTDFKLSYLKLVKAWSACDYTNYTTDKIFAVVDHYNRLQYELLTSIANKNTEEDVQSLLKDMLNYIQQVGLAYLSASDQVESKLSSKYAIATPLCIASMRSFANKIEQVKALINALFAHTVYVSDQALFDAAWKQNLGYYEGPELVLTQKRQSGNDLMLASQKCDGYTLYESAEQLQRSYSTNNQPLIEAHGSTIGSLQAAPSVYTKALVDHLRRYLFDAPYTKEYCTILIYHCGLLSLPLAIYRELLSNEEFAAIKFNLLIVNDDVNSTKDIYKSFEAERFKLGKGSQTDSNFIKRVQVEVVPKTSLASTGFRFSHMLLLPNLKLGENSPFERMADICLLFHPFDTGSAFNFDLNEISVVSDNDIRYQPTLLSFIDHSKGSEPRKFVTCPVQTLSSAIQLFAIAALSNHAKSFRPQPYHLSALAVQDKEASLRAADKVQVPLYLQEVDISKSNDAQQELVKKAHQLADEVLYFDSLVNKQYLKKFNVNVVYHHQLQDKHLNFMIASKEESDLTKNNYLQSLFADVKGDKAELMGFIHKDAVEISGSIIMQASQLQTRAYEMVGIALSRFLTEVALKEMQQALNKVKVIEDRPCFVMLDDYPYLFQSQRNKIRADLLCLQVLKYKQPQEGGNQYALIIFVVESKFLSAYLPSLANKSYMQAENSANIFYLALKNRGETIILDRKQNLSKLADIYGENASLRDHSTMLEVQRLMRNEQIDVIIKGCSFVFAEDAEKGNEIKSLKCDIKTESANTKYSSDDGRIPILQMIIRKKPTLSALFDAYYLSSKPTTQGNTKQEGTNYSRLEQLFTGVDDIDQYTFEDLHSYFNENEVIKLSPPDLSLPQELTDISDTTTTSTESPNETTATSELDEADGSNTENLAGDDEDADNDFYDDADPEDTEDVDLEEEEDSAQ